MHQRTDAIKPRLKGSEQGVNRHPIVGDFFYGRRARLVETEVVQAVPGREVPGLLQPADRAGTVGERAGAAVREAGTDLHLLLHAPSGDEGAPCRRPRGDDRRPRRALRS